MGTSWRNALAGAAVLFLTFLVVKLRPVRVTRRHREAEVRAARLRAHDAKTPRERAEALCEAAGLARRAHRFSQAAGFFLRAMNADPTWPVAVEAAVRSLERRPKLLEKMLWRRLARLPWDEPHRAAARAATEGLSRLYQRRIRDSAKAEFMRRLLKMFEG